MFGRYIITSALEATRPVCDWDTQNMDTIAAISKARVLHCHGEEESKVTRPVPQR